MQKYLLILFILSTQYSFGQDPYYEKVDSQLGLVSNNVYCAFQDNLGYMWFGTDMGVSRFNGYEFENFNSTSGLAADEVFSIYQDQNDRLWFLGANGKPSYYKNKKFYSSFNDSALQKIQSQTMLTGITEESNGDVYISSLRSGVFKITINGEVKKYTPKGRVYGMWTDNEGVFCLSSQGIRELIDNKFNITISENFLEFYPRFLKTKNGLVVGYGSKMFECSQKFSLKHTLKNSQQITQISEDVNGNIIVCTRRGFSRMNKELDSFVKIEQLNNSVISDFFIDREGNEWVTTLGNGIFFSSSPSISILNKENGLSENQVTALSVIKNAVWFGLSNGSFGKLENNQLTTYDAQNEQNQRVTKIIAAPDNSVLVCNKHDILNLKGGVISRINHFANDLCIANQKVFIGSNKLYILDSTAFFNSFGQSSVNRGNQNILEEFNVLTKGVMSLCWNYQDSTLFIGSRNGMYSYSDKNKCTIVPGTEGHTFNDMVFDTQRNLLFAATNNDGLHIYRDKKLIFKVSKTQGLSSNNCQSLRLSDDQKLWLGTTSGPNFIDLQSNQIVDFGALLGLSKKRIIDLEVFNNKLYLATDEGLLIVPFSTQLFIQDFFPALYLNTIYISGKQKPLKNYYELKHYENDIEIFVDGLFMKDLGGLKYHYILEGFQKKWRTTESRSIVFESLPPRDYKFKIFVESRSGARSKVLSLDFKIKKAYWDTWWFYSLCAFIITLTIIFVWLQRMKIVRNKFNLERQIVKAEYENLSLEKSFLEAEQKAGVLQMNPHFLFNSLNAIKGYYAEGQFKKGNLFLAKFSKLLRHILESNHSFISLTKELDLLELYIHLMHQRYNQSFEYKIETNIDNKDSVQIPPMLIQPLIENAIIHGLASKQDGLLQVKLNKVGNSLHITIEDNGVGFELKPSLSQNPVGLKNIEDRIKLLKRQLNQECAFHIGNSPSGTGVLVSITLPIIETEK